ncbi:MAG TPA: DUF2249 domain-containing protein [Lutibacter sp.]|nr:DUF2249 domain-containing protein [Lutibacter sp.]
MQVTRNTKISRILRENKLAVETISSINPHFKKLNNPVLRRVMAPRVTVKDAAKIGKVSINEFLQKLENIGFDVIFEEQTLETSSKTTKTEIEPSQIVVLDVRPTIESGADPFKEIMAGVKEMKESETLKVINVFEPIPLITILKEKGYKSWTNEVSANEYHTFFEKETPISHQEIVADMPISEGSFEEKLVSFGGNIREIDVRLLEMPEPMVNILKEIETLADDYVLLVNHKKVPQFLLPELKSRGYIWIHKEIEPGLTQLLVFKK